MIPAATTSCATSHDETTVDGAADARDGAKPSDASANSKCKGSVRTVGTASGTMPAAPALTLPSGFKIEVIASIPAPRELVSLPNGDLLVGTTGTDVWLVPNADASGAADAPVVFATVNDAPVQGVAFLADTCTVAIGSQHGIYSVAYRDGQTHATPGAPVTSLRTGPIAHSVDPSDDTDTHVTTSLGFAGGKLYASVGSSCNACAEVDPSRALVWTMNPDGSEKTQRAKNIRNVIAVATNPATGTVWLGGAGQDDLALGHPYEYFDALTVHPGEADYGWPSCEENQHAYVAGADCSGTVIPLIELPAYSTLIGATFYPTNQGGAYALPATYGGGLFVTAHGSWHRNTDNTFYSPPRVAYVAMNGDAPKVPADWSNPSAQWVEFIGGFQLSTGKARVGKPTGIAVGVQGSLFIADDQNGYVYRVRPG